MRYLGVHEMELGYKWEVYFVKGATTTKANVLVAQSTNESILKLI